LLTTSFRGGFGGLKTTLGGAKMVEAHGPCPSQIPSSGSPPHQLARHPPCYTCWMLFTKGTLRKRMTRRLGHGDPSCLARHQVGLALLGGSAGSLSNSEPPSGWQGSMAGFCVFGLRYWKRRVVRGYHRWRRTNLPWQANLPTPAQFVRCRMGMVLGTVQSVYEWTSKGGNAYHAQWALLRDSEDGLASVEAGHNAVRRSANASWFECLEGSTPLFWNWPKR
jgi:hypothetical protein